MPIIPCPPCPIMSVFATFEETDRGNPGGGGSSATRSWTDRASRRLKRSSAVGHRTRRRRPGLGIGAMNDRLVALGQPRIEQLAIGAADRAIGSKRARNARRWSTIPQVRRRNVAEPNIDNVPASAQEPRSCFEAGTRWMPHQPGGGVGSGRLIFSPARASVQGRRADLARPARAPGGSGILPMAGLGAAARGGRWG